MISHIGPRIFSGERPVARACAGGGRRRAHSRHCQGAEASRRPPCPPPPSPCALPDRQACAGGVAALASLTHVAPPCPAFCCALSGSSSPSSCPRRGRSTQTRAHAGAPALRPTPRTAGSVNQSILVRSSDSPQSPVLFLACLRCMGAHILILRCLVRAECPRRARVNTARSLFASPQAFQHLKLEVKLSPRPLPLPLSLPSPARPPARPPARTAHAPRSPPSLDSPSRRQDCVNETMTRAECTRLHAACGPSNRQAPPVLSSAHS